MKEPEPQTPYETRKVFLEETLDVLDRELRKLVLKMVRRVKKGGLPQNDYEILAFRIYAEFMELRGRLAELLIDFFMGEAEDD